MISVEMEQVAAVPVEHHTGLSLFLSPVRFCAESKVPIQPLA